jgi:hypothetical protein
MASGHVNRVNRPNTWLHRPMLQTFKKVLANSEPSTHGGKADMIATPPSASQESEPAWIIHIVRLLLRAVGVETSTDYISLTEMS